MATKEKINYVRRDAMAHFNYITERYGVGRSDLISHLILRYAGAAAHELKEPKAAGEPWPEGQPWPKRIEIRYGPSREATDCWIGAEPGGAFLLPVNEPYINKSVGALTPAQRLAFAEELIERYNRSTADQTVVDTEGDANV